MPRELLVALVGTFLAVGLLTGVAAYAVLARFSTTQRRLGSIRKPAGNSGVIVEQALSTERDPVLARWSKLLPKSAADMSRLERRLASGGFHTSIGVVTYSATTILLPIVLACAVLVGIGFRDPRAWVAAGVGGVVGYLVPGLFLDYKISARRKAIRNGLPDVLDLLIVCLEAGNSLDQAVVKASQELSIAYPALAHELRILTTETRAGKPRMDAFRNLAQRTKVDDIRALVAMLVQTDRFGTSVGQALRTMAGEMRKKRRQAAEEKAEKLGVKLVFPLVFCLFPALYIVILGPAVIAFQRAFPR
jgi:tight adherence protein C